jgi:phage-related protein
MLHKKSLKTPKEEIGVCKRRMQDFLERGEGYE